MDKTEHCEPCRLFNGYLKEAFLRIRSGDFTGYGVALFSLGKMIDYDTGNPLQGETGECQDCGFMSIHDKLHLKVYRNAIKGIDEALQGMPPGMAEFSAPRVLEMVDEEYERLAAREGGYTGKIKTLSGMARDFGMLE